MQRRQTQYCLTNFSNPNDKFKCCQNRLLKRNRSSRKNIIFRSNYLYMSGQNSIANACGTLRWWPYRRSKSVIAFVCFTSSTFCVVYLKYASRYLSAVTHNAVGTRPRFLSIWIKTGMIERNNGRIYILYPYKNVLIEIGERNI